ncbi:hypothetical protein AB0L63_14125 [Nocardia sp. NPDC051990]|uniref:hypothetical protein n=1 Tax=Nocardia sp. NPDC051990 TaxID=3155285 RepID=UPI00344517DC
MCDVFSNADHHLGGGYARATLARFLDDVVGPALRGSYDSRTAPELFAVAARLCDLTGIISTSLAYAHEARIVPNPVGLENEDGNDLIILHE